MSQDRVWGKDVDPDALLDDDDDGPRDDEDETTGPADELLDADDPEGRLIQRLENERSLTEQSAPPSSRPPTPQASVPKTDGITTLANALAEYRALAQRHAIANLGGDMLAGMASVLLELHEQLEETAQRLDQLEATINTPLLADVMQNTKQLQTSLARVMRELATLTTTVNEVKTQAASTRALTQEEAIKIIKAETGFVTQHVDHVEQMIKELRSELGRLHEAPKAVVTTPTTPPPIGHTALLAANTNTVRQRANTVIANNLRTVAATIVVIIVVVTIVVALGGH